MSILRFIIPIKAFGGSSDARKLFPTAALFRDNEPMTLHWHLPSSIV
jgi:hypothetical protein